MSQIAKFNFSTIIVIVGVIFVILGGLNVHVVPFEVARAPSSSGGGTTTSSSGGSTTDVTYTWDLSGSISASPTSVPTGVNSVLSVSVSYYSTTNSPPGGTSILFYVNGADVGYAEASGTGTYTYDWQSQTIGSFSFTAQYISSYNPSTGSTTHSAIGGSVGITVTGNKPTIISASASPSPIYAGNSTTFTATVNWGGNTGTLSWSVSPGAVVLSGTSPSYTFMTAGKYTVTATATNQYGTVTSSFTLTVLSTTITSTSSPIQNIGDFYLESPSGTFVELTSTSNIVFNFATYPQSLNVFYVEDHGTTTNISGAYVVINGQSVSLNVKTSYKTYVAYESSITFTGMGQYAISGGLVPANGSLNLQLFSITGTFGTSTTTTVTNVVTSNVDLFDIGIGISLILVGLVLKWKLRM